MSTSTILPREQIIKAVTRVLSRDDRVFFAYLYGSFVADGQGNDIDLAVFSKDQVDSHLLSADVKIALHKETGLPPYTFDVRDLKGLVEKSDLFGLLYLRNVLDNGQLLVDNDPDTRADFLERYGLKFRECEGLIQEVLA